MSSITRSSCRSASDRISRAWPGLFPAAILAP